ncbi:MAG TPA: hypothetical protein VHN11_13150 [Xanthobacteraceae bacterium]|jgi:hypothetical protein|nr:hypothetical protein [Xanthobacteraceae bacterium]
MDVYLNSRRDLLVVKRGALIPAAALPGSWRKSNKRVVKVSAEIESAIKVRGYYMRKLTRRPEKHAGS